ncbi:MAG: CapA family protein [Armatimonadetes bacterium]|nr:CapA family protein [Armatimonadota bacterium]
MQWTLAAVGDIMLTHPLGASGCHDLLREATLAFANLEVPLSARGHPADKPIAFRADPVLAGELAKIGLDVVTFANNHALDYGIPALLDTVTHVEASGVGCVGVGETLETAAGFRVLGAGDVRVAFGGFNCTLPPGAAASPQRPGTAPLRVEASYVADATLEEQPGTSPYVRTTPFEPDLRYAADRIREAKRSADVVVVSVHWGVPPGWAAPFQGTLADYQPPMAHALIDAGADVILGHHPHTLHGVEIYRGKPILYSLGNYVFHVMAPGAKMPIMRPLPPYRWEFLSLPELHESAVFQLRFDDSGRTLWSIELVPCAFDDRGESQVASGARAAAILRRFAAHCDALGTRVEVRDGRAKVRIS